MKKLWNEAPLVRLIIPFLSGIAIESGTGIDSYGCSLILAVLMIAFSGMTLLQRLYPAYKNAWIAGVLISGSVFLLAVHLTFLKKENLAPGHFSQLTDGKEDLFIGSILESPVEKERSVKTVIRIRKIYHSGKWLNTTGKALAYFEKSEKSLMLDYGDDIIISANPEMIPLPANPYEFNYREFLAGHKIYQQVYVNTNAWKKLGSNSGNFFFRWSLSCRNYLLHCLETQGLKGDELAVGAALMLGYTDKLDADIMTAYAGTGALHVLSVSGLHAAIVYIVFSWLLGFLDKFKHGAVIKAGLLILLLWFYAALTGLSPSVLRAAAMFSFIVIAKTFRKQSTIYNTLAASAILILIIDPFLLKDVGFQLSYIAVVGIVWLQPMISSWFDPDNWLLEQVWSITAVSIAAQLATFPLGLYYFHQFPNYFLLSNLVVIPLSTLIIYTGIALFMSASIPLFVKYLALAFGWMIWLLNFSVKWIGGLPFAVVNSISFHMTEMVLVYALIISLVFFVSRRQYIYFLSSLILIVFILFVETGLRFERLHRRELVVYDIRNRSGMDLTSGTANLFCADSSLIADNKALTMHIKPNWTEKGVTEDKRLVLNKDQLHIFTLAGKKIAFLRSVPRNLPDRPLKVDYLIIAAGASSDIETVERHFSPGLIILDSSNKLAMVKRWKNEFVKRDQKYYSVAGQGVFVADLR
ncbi:MAG: ComEC/Rec2 family competence protein [Bacteroidia bacterium]